MVILFLDMLDRERVQRKHKRRNLLLRRCIDAVVRLRLQTANFTLGSRRYARDHIGSRLPGETVGRCVNRLVSSV